MYSVIQERVVVGNLSDKLGTSWELGIESAAAGNSVGIGWESGSPKITWEPKCGAAKDNISSF